MDRTDDGSGVAPDLMAVPIEQGTAADHVVDVATGDVPQVGVFGHGFDELTLSDAVCAVDLDEGDPLIAEWNVVVISPNFAATLTARQVGEPSPSNDSFEFILTHDRRLTIEAARTLVARL